MTGIKEKNKQTGSHRSNSEDGRHQCGSCDSSFSRAADLKRHANAVHEGIKGFECRECGKAFAQKAAMQTHENIHLGITPYRCRVANCDHAPFSDPSSRNRHEYRLHAPPSFYCPEGCRAFNRKDALRGHIDQHHPLKAHQYTESQLSSKMTRKRFNEEVLGLGDGLHPQGEPINEAGDSDEADRVDGRESYLPDSLEWRPTEPTDQHHVVSKDGRASDDPLRREGLGTFSPEILYCLAVNVDAPAALSRLDVSREDRIVHNLNGHSDLPSSSFARTSLSLASPKGPLAPSSISHPLGPPLIGIGSYPAALDFKLDPPLVTVNPRDLHNHGSIVATSESQPLSPPSPSIVQSLTSTPCDPGSAMSLSSSASSTAHSLFYPLGFYHFAPSSADTPAEDMIVNPVGHAYFPLLDM